MAHPTPGMATDHPQIFIERFDDIAPNMRNMLADQHSPTHTGHSLVNGMFWLHHPKAQWSHIKRE